MLTNQYHDHFEPFRKFIGEQYEDEINTAINAIAKKYGYHVNVVNEDMPATMINIDVDKSRLTVVLDVESRIKSFNIG